ncbi:hypothetical protein BH09ACT6_BH09ACT6_12710 [soil metagenome]
MTDFEDHPADTSAPAGATPVTAATGGAEADTTAILADWAARLAAELSLPGAPVDIDAILSLAGAAAHAVTRPAAPLTTYLVGYSAGLAAGRGTEPATAFADATATARALAATWRQANDTPTAPAR